MDSSLLLNLRRRQSFGGRKKKESIEPRNPSIRTGKSSGVALWSFNSSVFFMAQKLVCFFLIEDVNLTIGLLNNSFEVIQ